MIRMRSLSMLFIVFGAVRAAQPDEAFVGLPHPSANAWPGRQVALLIEPAGYLIDPVSPRVVLYDDGTILRGDPAPRGEMRYLVSVLKADELRRLLESIGPTVAFRALKDRYHLAPDTGALPRAAVILSDRSGHKVVEVVGYSLNGQHSGGSAGSFRSNSVPREFDRVCKLLLGVKPRNAVPWVPRYVEVSLRPAGNSGEPALPWPAKWPTLTDRLAFGGPFNWSLMLKGSDLPELRALADRHRPVALGGKNWTISWMPVIPGGTWAGQIEARLQKAPHRDR